MRSKWLPLVCLLNIAGCGVTVEDNDGGTVKCPQVDMRSLQMDMAPPAPKCAAAKGLPGENLLCADFVSPQTIVDLTAAGWSFTTSISGTCTGWTVTNGKLQVNSYATVANGSCGFTLPALSATDYQKFSSFTLSIIHRVDISETASQKVQVMLGADDPLSRLVTQWTGKGSRQTSTMAMSKADLPNGGTGSYQPLLKISSTTTAGGSFQGWQIESIAVNGIP